jgi:cysteine synthase A
VSDPLVAENVLRLVGRTPLVQLQRIPGSEAARVLGKLESRNPGGSIKDRIALSMIEAAEEAGDLHPGDTIVEPTSGNTGIGLALVAAVKGYRLILTMPEDMSLERRKLLSRFGAEFVLTPALEGMTGAVYAAEQLKQEHGYFMPQQFENPANPQIHAQTTGPEILQATGGALDAFVVAVGTGGTITGAGGVLREAHPALLIVAVEPERSQVLAGKRPRPHAIQGIGASFVPRVLDRSLVDEIMPVGDDEAITMTERLAREEGLLVGISAGANVHAACLVARRLGPGKTVVTILPDTGERYLSLAD